MIMVPARNLLPQHHASYGGCLAGRADAGATTPSSASKFMLIRSSSSSDHFLIVDHMAEDESRTSSFNDAAAGSSRQAQQQAEKEADDDEEDKDGNNKSSEDRDVGWLQLGLGSHAAESGHRRARLADQRPGLIELDLFTDGRHRASPSTAPAFHVSDFAAARPASYGASTSFIAPTLPFYHPHHSRTSLSIGQQPEMTWGYRHGPWDPTAAAASSSSMPFYASRQFQHPYMPSAFTAAVAADVGPSSSTRIIDPPPMRRRPGLWFVLQASHNQ